MIFNDKIAKTSRQLSLLSAFFLLAGCAATLESRHHGPPKLLKSNIQQFYARHAREEGGHRSCPFIDAITQVNVIEDTPERWVADVRYKYRDRLRDEDPGSERRICRGFAPRTFTLVPEGDRLVVADMSGRSCRGSHFSLNRAFGLKKGVRTCPA